MKPWKRSFSIDELYKFYPPGEADALSVDNISHLLIGDQPDGTVGLKYRQNESSELHRKYEILEALKERLNWFEDIAFFLARRTGLGLRLKRFFSVVTIPVYVGMGFMLYFGLKDHWLLAVVSLISSFAWFPLGICIWFFTPGIFVPALRGRNFEQFQQYITDQYAQPIRSLPLQNRILAIEQLRQKEYDQQQQQLEQPQVIKSNSRANGQPVTTAPVQRTELADGQPVSAESVQRTESVKYVSPSGTFWGGFNQRIGERAADFFLWLLIPFVCLVAVAVLIVIVFWFLSR